MSRPTLPLNTDEVRRRLAVALMTQSDLAYVAGIHVDTMSALMTGRARATYPTLAALALALGCEPADIVATEPASA